MVTVAEAADAATALALAEDTHPSVALVDLLLPDDVTGLALVRGLSQRPGCAVVAMSVRGGLRAARWRPARWRSSRRERHRRPPEHGPGRRLWATLG